MATNALLVRLEAKSGKEGAVEEFLPSALPLVEQEPGTRPWFAVRFGTSTFGIIDAVPGRGGTRDASWRARRKGPRGESRRALRLATRHQQSRRHSQQALTPLRLSTRFCRLRSAHAGRRRHRGNAYTPTRQTFWRCPWSRDLAFLRPVRPGACIGLGTDRTMSITASGCEGSHTDGRVGDGAGGAPRRGHTTGIGRGAHRSRRGGCLAECWAAVTGTEVIEWRRRR